MGIVLKAMTILAFLMPAALAASPAVSATAARHYDCSKAGNANKAACKGAPSAAAPATPTRTTTSKTAATTTTRHYDCTKAGNATKAACKTAGAQTPSGQSPGAVKTSTKTTSTTTDCTRWYNRMRAVCRTSTASSPTKTTVAPAPRPAATTAASSNSGGENNNPNGATAQCKDGTFSHAAHHQGACSRHGGVAKWLS